ncbi:MAG: NCS2 family permease [Deltaproteobacteria bacterium]|nr:NCS2 family permease [Deltaproteobacteria bacterium]
MFERYFKLSEHGSNINRELLGGVTTYLSMVYIVFVQPVVLSAAGMDFGAVLTATCLGSAFACIMMGLLANYPIALAPAMGHNFYFAYAVILGMGVSWQQALTAVFIAGILFFILSLTSIRHQLINAIPKSLGSAIGCGIGLLISLVGFEWGGIIVSKPGTYVGLGDLGSPPALITLAGLTLTAIFHVRKIAGATMLGILATAVIALLSGVVNFHGVFSAPPSLAPTFCQLDFSGFMTLDMIVIIAIFLFLDIFDTLGTLIGIAPEAGLIKDGKIEIKRSALLADAGGTIAGALLGTSTITSYVESSTGIQAGARTGLAAIVTGILLLITPFFYPLIQLIGGGIKVSEVLTLYPITSPALIIIGVMMMQGAKDIDWHSPADAIPAFLTIIVVQLSVSITDGIAFGFISYSILSLFNGRFRSTSPAIHICALLLLLRYIFFV